MMGGPIVCTSYDGRTYCTPVSYDVRGPIVPIVRAVMMGGPIVCQYTSMMGGPIVRPL